MIDYTNAIAIVLVVGITVLFFGGIARGILAELFKPSPRTNIPVQQMPDTDPNEYQAH